METDETDGMKPPPSPHYRHRFPAEIISRAVWLYHEFSLSLRDVELLLAERGVVASYETIRRWCNDKWHLDEVFIRIQGVQHYLWCAVDQEGSCSTSSFSHRGMPKQQSDPSDDC